MTESSSATVHETGCAIELVHHTRKTGGNETVMEDMRGAVDGLLDAYLGDDFVLEEKAVPR